MALLASTEERLPGQLPLAEFNYYMLLYYIAYLQNNYIHSRDYVAVVDYSRNSCIAVDYVVHV